MTEKALKVWNVLIRIEKIKHSIIRFPDTKIIESIRIKIEGINTTVGVVFFPGTKLNREKLETFKLDLKLLTTSRRHLLCGDLNARHQCGIV